MSQTSDERPLAGIRVLDLISGPMGAIGRQLAEFGADVIRLEPADGAEDRRMGPCSAGLGLAFAAANLGKRATTLDRFEGLVGEADMLIAPLGRVDAAALRGRHPTLVIMTVSDFGETGRFSAWHGSGPVFHALTGELSRSGIPGREPLLPPGDLAHACASAQAAMVLLLAYWNRLKTGEGDRLDFSILDGAGQALDPGYGIAGSATAGVPASKLPRGRPEARFQYPIIPCQDGFVRLCVLAPRQWRGMFEWMGKPEEFADPSFDLLQNRFKSTTLIPAITAFFSDKTRKRLEEEGQRYGVPTAAVLNLNEALETEQMVARNAFVPVEFAPGVEAPFPNGVVEIDGERMGVAGPPPLVSAEAGWRTRGSDVPFPDTEGDRPLAGLRVLDLGVIVVGAESGRLLADQGADVVKVENAAFPDGSRQNRAGGLMSPTFATGHRNKRGLGLNLRDPAGKDLLYKLVAQSDVVLSNFKGGTLESLGLDYATLKQVNPGIILTDSSAFGPSGPWSKRMGYGPLVRASAGLTTQWRYPGEPDSFSDAMTVYPDHVASRIGVIGVLAVLIRRLRTGIGGSVSVSQAEVMLSHMAPQIASDALERADHGVVGNDPESAVYRCAGDDEWCVVTIRSMADEAAVARLTGGAPLADWIAQQSPIAAMEALQGAGVPAGAMLRVVDLPQFEYYVERGFFREAHHPQMPEPFIVEGAPVRSERLADPLEVPAPLPGEHTCELIRDRLGLSQADIDALVASKALEQFTMPEGTAA
jgi:crotonobetainyl-CoA:carnitine CoA-transferase CaiB-like acyl-CoA transferase